VCYQEQKSFSPINFSGFKLFMFLPNSIVVYIEVIVVYIEVSLYFFLYHGAKEFILGNKSCITVA